VSVASTTSTPLTNNVSVACTCTEANTNNNSGMDQITVTQLADLQVSKTHSPSSFIVNDASDQIPITVSNSGLAATSGTVTVTDVLPTGLTYVSSTGAGWNCSSGTPNAQTVKCTTTNAIAATNGTSMVTLNVSVAANASSPLTNNVSVACTCTETNTGNNSNTDMIPVLQTVGVTLATSPSGLQVSGDGGTTFFTAPHTFQFVPNTTHTIVTTSPQSGGAGVQYVWLNWSDTGAISHVITAGTSAATYTANFKTQYMVTTNVSPSATYGSISPASGYVDANSMVSFTATPNSGNTFLNFSGTFNSNNNPLNQTITGPTTETANFAALPDLAISKSHAPATHFSQGQNGATYSITVSNNGPGATSGTVTVTDTFPTGLTEVSMAGTGWTCGAPNNPANVCTRTDSLGASGSYQPITVTVNVSSTAAGTVTNTATVSATGDYNSSNNTAMDPTTVNPIADVSGQVSLTQTGFGRNRSTGIYSATLTVTNTSAATINGPIEVVFTNISPNATMVNYTGTRNGSPYMAVTPGALAPGASASVTVQFTNPSNGFITYNTTVNSGVY